MPQIGSMSIFAIPPGSASLPDSLTRGDHAIWVEYGNNADPTGLFGSSTIVQYSPSGKIEHSYSIAGHVDGLKFDPQTGDVWALQNEDGNSTLTLIDPVTGQVSAPLSYGAPYVYGANSTHGFDDVVFDGSRVFLSETNPTGAGDPVVVQLENGQSPFGTLQTTPILLDGATGMNLTTGKVGPIPLNDPDSLKMLPNGALLLTSGDDGTLTMISHPGTTQQSESWIQIPGVPKGSAGLDDAIVPRSSSGTFYVSSQDSNQVFKVTASGLDTHDIYASVGSLNEVVQIDPTTGKVTPFITGLNSPHGLMFVPSQGSADGSGAGGSGQTIYSDGGQTLQGSSQPETIVMSDVAGVAGDMVQGGPGALSFIGGSASDTVTGGAGGLTVFGGTGGGGVFTGGPQGNNVLNAGTGNATLIGGGSADVLNAGATGDDVLAAGNGNETLNGAGSTGNIDFLGGRGADAITLGSGNDTVMAGPGADTLDVFNGQAGGNDLVAGFRPSSDKLVLAGYGPDAAAQVLNNTTTAGATTVLTLPDNTHLALLGVGHLNATDIVST